MNGHELIVSRGDFASFYALCKGCPAWTGAPEQTRPEAIRHHTVHAAHATAPVLATAAWRS